jgi:hypothetical protein
VLKTCGLLSSQALPGRFGTSVDVTSAPSTATQNQLGVAARSVQDMVPTHNRPAVAFAPAAFRWGAVLPRGVLDTGDSLGDLRGRPVNHGRQMIESVPSA